MSSRLRPFAGILLLALGLGACDAFQTAADEGEGAPPPAATPTGDPVEPAGGAPDPSLLWPSWRGPSGNGVGADDANPPTTWSPTENVGWKTPLPGAGHSTPVVWGDRIYVTAAVPDGDPAPPSAGRRPGEHDNHRAVAPHRFVVLAIDRRDGSIVWERTVHEASPHEGGHDTGTYASASPVTDGERVYASFGSAGLFCLDRDGELLWKRDLGDMNTKHGHGEGSGPALAGDTLVVVWDHEGPSFAVGLDKRTGDERWRHERDEPTSWATPLVLEHDGATQVVVAATGRIRAYDPETGDVIWECGGLSNNVVASPVAADGMVFAGSSYETKRLLAIRLDGAKGDITGSKQIAWSTDRRTPYVPSPLLHDGRLYYLAHYQGIITAVDAKTGEPIFGPVRLPEIGSTYASPVAAAGRVYVVGEDGTTVVIETGKPEVIAVNELGESVAASPAIVGDAILIRGAKHLFSLGVPAPDGGD